MRLYDPQGRLVIAQTVVFELTDARYVRKDTSDVLVGASYTWNIAGANFRIKNGKMQVQNDTTGLWHTQRVNSQDGVLNWFFDVNGEA